MICACGAPVRGVVCQRGHRALREDWASYDAGRAGGGDGGFKHGDPIKPSELRVGHTFSKAGLADRFTVIGQSKDGQTLHVKGDDEPFWQARAHHTNITAEGDQPRVPKPGIIRSPKTPAMKKFMADEMRHDFHSGYMEESAQTAALSVTHAPIGKGGKNWVTKTAPGNTGQLPAYIQNIRNAIMRGGKSEGEATGLAVAAVKRWAEGRGGVTAEVKAAAAKAVAQWESLRAKSKATKGVKAAA